MDAGKDSQIINGGQMAGSHYGDFSPEIHSRRASLAPGLR